MSIKKVYDWYVKEGYLAAVRLGGLWLYNYTARTVYEGNWNFHTRTARGLVLDAEGRIQARPWPKFFNLNERPETAPGALPPEVPELAEKLDGSLVIVFWNPEAGRWQACTRGAWDNAQCAWAREWLGTCGIRLERGYTYLFELVGPWNRIVLLYPETAMILLGVVHTESGEDWSYRRVQEWGQTRGIRAVRSECRPLESVRLEDPTVVNEEGYVARFGSGFRVKLKYHQYLRLHQLITGLSVRGIWEHLTAGTPLDLSLVPDEFLGWFEVEQTALLGRKRELEFEARERFGALPRCPDRKTYALEILKIGPPWPPILFRMLDGRPIEDLLWKEVRPSGHRTFRSADPKGPWVEFDPPAPRKNQ